MKERDEKIKKRLDSDYKLLEDQGYEVLGTFLFGSQNYNLDDENSDVDIIGIIIPDLKTIIKSKNRKSYSDKELSSGKLVTKDILSVYDLFLDSNINMIEILFTKWNKINPKYQDLFKIFLDNKEDIAHLNEEKAISCFIGCIRSIAKKSEYTGKSISNIFRLYSGFLNYTSNESFDNVLHLGYNNDLIDYCKRLKRDKIDISNNKISAIITGIIFSCTSEEMNFKSKEYNNDLVNILDEAIISIIKRRSNI